MEPTAERLVMYGSEADAGGLEWSWVRERLIGADGYWLVTPTSGHPHPRPVWGVWHDGELLLSIGSPRLRADTAIDAAVTVHLSSVTDVVILEGRAAGQATDEPMLAVYNAKYGWDYTVEEYGPLTRILPSKVIAWRSGGWAGREGFQQTGRWSFSRAGD